MCRIIVIESLKFVKSNVSSSSGEAKRKVLKLYRDFYRHTKYIEAQYGVPCTKAMCVKKIREEFEKHRHVTDPRTIDLLLHHGRIEYRDIVDKFKTTDSIMYYFPDTVKPKPSTFLAKFFDGVN